VRKKVKVVVLIEVEVVAEMIITEIEEVLKGDHHHLLVEGISSHLLLNKQKIVIRNNNLH